MPAKRTTRQNQSAPEKDHPSADSDPGSPDTIPEMVDDYQEDINERFRNLFANEDEDIDVRVQLRRTEPTGTLTCPRTGVKLKIDGPLEWLPPFLQDYESHITERYGGGTFLAQRRENGQITKNEYIIIASRSPKVYDPDVKAVPSTEQPTPPVSQENPPRTGGGPKVNIEGADFDLDEDDQKLMRQVLKWHQIREIINPTPPAQPRDINPAILEALLSRLDRPQPNPLEPVQILGSLIETVRPLLSEGGGGAADGWATVLNNAVTQVGKLVEKSSRLPAARPGLASTEPARLPAPANGDQPDKAEQPNIQEEPMRNDPRQLAANAIANINSSFRKTTPIPVDQMVDALDFALDLDQETRATVGKYKQEIVNMATLEMEAYFEEHPDKEDAYREYFEQVFDEFVRADREVKTIS